MTVQVKSNSNETKSLADILLSQGALNEEKLKQIKLTEIQTGKLQEEIIKERKLVSEEALVKARAELYNFPYIDLTTIPISSEALTLLSQDVAERFKIFPFSVDMQTKQLNLAMADPLDLTATEFVEQKTGYIVKPYAAEPSKVETLISAGYTTSLAREVTEALKEVSRDGEVKTFDIFKTG